MIFPLFVSCQPKVDMTWCLYFWGFGAKIQIGEEANNAELLEFKVWYFRLILISTPCSRSRSRYCSPLSSILFIEQLYGFNALSLNSSYGINIQSEKLRRLKRTKTSCSDKFCLLLKYPESKPTISSKISSKRLSINQLEDFFSNQVEYEVSEKIIIVTIS